MQALPRRTIHPLCLGWLGPGQHPRPTWVGGCEGVQRGALLLPIQLIQGASRQQVRVHIPRLRWNVKVSHKQQLQGKKGWAGRGMAGRGGAGSYLGAR